LGRTNAGGGLTTRGKNGTTRESPTLSRKVFTKLMILIITIVGIIAHIPYIGGHQLILVPLIRVHP